MSISSVRYSWNKFQHVLGSIFFIMMDSFSLILRNFEYRSRKTDICACLNICICFPVSDMQCIFCSLIFFTEANSSTTHFWVGNKKGNAVDWATPKWKHQQVRYLSVCTQTAVKLVISSQCDFLWKIPSQIWV